MQQLREKTQETINTYFTTKQQNLGRLIVDGNQLYYKQDLEHPSLLQELISGSASDLKEVAGFCINHAIPSMALEEAIRKNNASCLFWARVPLEMQSELQQIRLNERANTWQLDTLCKCALAVENDAEAYLQELLENNELSQKDLDDLLIKAAQSGKTYVVKTLIQNSANPNCQDTEHNNWTPLLYAVDCANLSTCQALIKAGASIDLGHAGFTPLMLACQKGNTEIVRLLIKHKANILQQNYGESRTPLAWACASGNLLCVKELIKYSPQRQLALRDASTKTAIELANEHGHQEIVMLLNR